MSESERPDEIEIALDELMKERPDSGTKSAEPAVIEIRPEELQLEVSEADLLQPAEGAALSEAVEIRPAEVALERNSTFKRQLAQTQNMLALPNTRQLLLGLVMFGVLVVLAMMLLQSTDPQRGGLPDEVAAAVFRDASTDPEGVVKACEATGNPSSCVTQVAAHIASLNGVLDATTFCTHVNKEEMRDLCLVEVAQVWFLWPLESSEYRSIRPPDIDPRTALDICRNMAGRAREEGCWRLILGGFENRKISGGELDSICLMIPADALIRVYKNYPETSSICQVA